MHQSPDNGIIQSEMDFEDRLSLRGPIFRLQHSKQGIYSLLFDATAAFCPGRTAKPDIGDGAHSSLTHGQAHAVSAVTFPSQFAPPTVSLRLYCIMWQLVCPAGDPRPLDPRPGNSARQDFHVQQKSKFLLPGHTQRA
jgi:hypothetical protein